MVRFRRHVFPRTASDLIAFLFLTSAALTVFFHDLYLIRLIINHQSNANYVYLPLLLLLFVAVNVIGNFVNLILTDTSIMNLYSFSKLKPDWHFCPLCEANSPPRSFHCDICKICVLRRDHHCTFSGCCIGYFNHRYYIAFVFYMWLGAIISFFFNCYSDFFRNNFTTNPFWLIVYHVFPVLFWGIGILNLKTFFAFLISTAIVYGWMFLSFLLYYHCSLILKGQTTYENSHNILTYSLPYWKENVIEVMGKNWFKALCWFNFYSPLPGNGADFHITNKRY